jgi:hypothetical protein
VSSALFLWKEWVIVHRMRLQNRLIPSCGIGFWQRDDGKG